jgi:4-hydroxy-3-methylbut-2-en-1-yl diphosphate reductase
MLSEIDPLLVIGSANSSNSTRLVETAQAAGIAAHMIEDDEKWLEGATTVGLTSGASVPERLLSGVCEWFKAGGVGEIAPFAAHSEDVFFKLPLEVSRAPARTAA